MNSGLIPGDQSLSKRQTVFFLLVNPMDKEHKDPETIDLKAPRLARYLQTAWKKHQNTVYWVDIRLSQKKGLKFYLTRSNAIILCNTLPACCIPKAIKMETGEIIYEKVYASRQLLPKISFKDNWRKELGSEVVGHGESCQQTQTKTTNPIVRTGRPVSTEQPSSSSAQEIDESFLLGYESTNERTRRPVFHCVPVSVESLDKDKDADENVDFDPIFKLQSLSKIVYTASQANKLKSLFLQNNTGDGIPLQAHRGGTSLNGIGSKLMRIFSSDLLFVTFGFVCSR